MKIYNLLFALFLTLSRACAIDDCRNLNNCQLIDFIESEIKFKKTDLSCHYDCVGSVFALDEKNDKEFFFFFSIYSSDMTKFEGEIILKFVSNLKNIKKILSSNPGKIRNIKEKFVIKALSFSFVDNSIKYASIKYASLYFMRDRLGLRIDPDKEKGCVYYTVPSVEKLDDIHMIYESKDGKERKEFVFTKSGIIPIEDTIGWQIQNGWNKFRNFFSFSTKHEEVKNEGYDCDNEKTRLKEKMY